MANPAGLDGGYSGAGGRYAVDAIPGMVTLEGSKDVGTAAGAKPVAAVKLTVLLLSPSRSSRDCAVGAVPAAAVPMTLLLLPLLAADSDPTCPW